jgi:hypothetical protein
MECLIKKSFLNVKPLIPFCGACSKIYMLLSGMNLFFPDPRYTGAGAKGKAVKMPAMTCERCIMGDTWHAYG